MNSSSILFLSVEKGKVIIKPSYTKYEDNINTTNSFNLLYETDYKDLNDDWENQNLNLKNLIYDNKKSKFSFIYVLKENCKDEIENIQNSLINRFIKERFPF